MNTSNDSMSFGKLVLAILFALVLFAIIGWWIAKQTLLLYWSLLPFTASTNVQNKQSAMIY